MLQVGEVSRQLGLNPQTLYFYERIGLIPPPQRTESGIGSLANKMWIGLPLLHGLSLWGLV